MCGDPSTAIHDVQGSGPSSLLAGTEVAVEGVVVGDFQNNAAADSGDLNGFFLQDPVGDGDAATSDGVFVSAPGGIDVAAGDEVRVRGTVAEFFGQTRINAGQVWICSSGVYLPTATAITLPVADAAALEAYEGMLVTFPQALAIGEYFNFDRFGEVLLSSRRHLAPTAEFEPGPAAIAAAQEIVLDRITLDDGRAVQNPDPALHPNGSVFDLGNLFRGGDTVRNVTGVMDYGTGLYRIQPTAPADYLVTNPRPAAPDDVGGTLKFASFNTLNYFTTIDTGAFVCGPQADQACRGADSAEELTRQRAKLVAALVGIDADVVGLTELENPRAGTADTALADLVAGLNAALGAPAYAFVDTGTIGSDAIKVGLIYKPAAVSPVGAHAVLDSSVDPRFLDTKNRPSLAQSFMDITTGGVLTMAMNHFKSKGSSCDDVGDPDTGDGSGNCNLTRTAAAEALVDWLGGDPTGSGDRDFLILGDLNSYDKEGPIDALRAGGYADLVERFLGEGAYTYVFDGQAGCLDHALAGGGLLDELTGATVWHVNADEPDLIDYDTSFKQPAQDALYAPDAYRFSDHDPVIVGLDVCDEVPPTISVSVTPRTLWPPNHKYVNVTAKVSAGDNFDPSPAVTLVSVTSSEPENGKGDGNKSNDIVIIDDLHFKLRAERSGGAAGRTYTITYAATDACGNSTTGSATVVVPLNQSRRLRSANLRKWR
jgi:hypothetical protein